MFNKLILGVTLALSASYASAELTPLDPTSPDVAFDYTQHGSSPTNAFIDRGSAIVDRRTGLEWLDLGYTIGTTPCEYEAAQHGTYSYGDQYTCSDAPEGNSARTVNNDIKNLVGQGWRIASSAEAMGFLGHVFDSDFVTTNQENIGLYYHYNSDVEADYVPINDDFLGRYRNTGIGYTHTGYFGYTAESFAPAYQNIDKIQYSSSKDVIYQDNLSGAKDGGFADVGMFLVRSYDSNRAVLESDDPSSMGYHEQAVYNDQYMQQSRVANVSAPLTAFAGLGLLLLGVRRRR